MTRRMRWFTERLTMSIITVKRTMIKRTPYRRSLVLRSFRELTRSYFASEKSWEFAVEALLFAIIAAMLSAKSISSRAAYARTVARRSRRSASNSSASIVPGEVSRFLWRFFVFIFPRQLPDFDSSVDQK